MMRHSFGRAASFSNLGYSHRRMRIAVASARVPLVILLFLPAVLLTPTPSVHLQAQSGVAGTWRAESSPPGTTWTAVLVPVGSNRLTGMVSSCSSNRNQIEIVEGRRDGNTVTFKCSSINRARTLAFTGQLDGDVIRFSWEKSGQGGNPTDDALFGAAAPAAFVARRISSGATESENSLAAAANALRKDPRVSFDHIVRSAETPENWLTFSGNLQGHRHSPLSQIDRSNVGDLELAWLRQAPTIGHATPDAAKSAHRVRPRALFPLQCRRGPLPCPPRWPRHR